MINNNERFNKLKVLRFSHNDARHRKHYVFICDCGNEVTVHGSAVKSGNTKSCGCLARNLRSKKRALAQKTKQGAKTAIYLGYKRHAKERGYDFNISKKEVLSVIFKDCYYCGAIPENLKKTKNDNIGLLYNGIDRVDNNTGYNTNNCVPCCKKCNQAKGVMSVSEFKEWIVKISAMADQWG